MLKRPDDCDLEPLTREGEAQSAVHAAAPIPVKLYPGWLRLLLLVGAPGLFWIGLIALVLHLMHR